MVKRDTATEEHIEAGLDRWVQQRQAKGVRGSTISREISTVLAVVRFTSKHWRLGLKIDGPTIKDGTEYKQRLPLEEPEQKQLLAAALEEGGPNGVALLLMLTTGMIASEIQRLPLSNVHLDGPVPYLLIDGETKTEARKRPVPIVVELEWLRDQIQQIQQRPSFDGLAPMALGRRWCELKNPSAKLTARVRKIMPEASAYSLRHSFRLNATIHNAHVMNAAHLGGWTDGVNGIMMNYGKAGLTNTDALKALADTARDINTYFLGET
jgi:site-specific recombinase XerD